MRLSLRATDQDNEQEQAHLLLESRLHQQAVIERAQAVGEERKARKRRRAKRTARWERLGW
jgi:hypothetical protein